MKISKNFLVMVALVVTTFAGIAFIADSGKNYGKEYYDKHYNFSAKNYERETERTAEQTTERATKRTTERTTERATERATERTTEKATTKTATSVKPVVDTRVPNYTITSNECTKVTYAWENFGRTKTWSTYINLRTEMYDYYSSLDRYYYLSDYEKYIYDEHNAKLCKDLAEYIYNKALENGASKYDAVMDVIAFVQNLEYQSDLDENGEAIEYPKYPVETLMEKGGDCEDTAILLATMLRELGYGTAIIHFEGHLMVGIKGGDTITGTYFEKDGGRYFVVETTAKGWGIGVLPEKYEGQSAYVYVM